MGKCVVRRDGKRDLSFEGDLLAEVSSHYYQGARNTRWTEISIYQVQAGGYVVAVVGRTRWQNEDDRFRAEICGGPAEVLAVLEQAQEGGGVYLSSLAKRAIEEAAEKDAGFASILYESLP